MNIVTINNKQFPVIEYRGQRVVTFAMIDDVHQRPEGTPVLRLTATVLTLSKGWIFLK